MSAVWLVRLTPRSFALKVPDLRAVPVPDADIEQAGDPFAVGSGRADGDGEVERTREQGEVGDAVAGARGAGLTFGGFSVALRILQEVVRCVCLARCSLR